MTLHPAIDVLITAGRDSTARVWDMRTKANVHTLTGHTNTVASVISQATEPQVHDVFRLFEKSIYSSFSFASRCIFHSMLWREKIHNVVPFKIHNYSSFFIFL